MSVVWRRLLAWVIDWLTILVWVGVLAAIGVPLYLGGFTTASDPLVLNAVAAALLVIPATIWLAAFEAGGKHATLGKRALRLRVVPVEGAQLTFARALLRNGLKITVPWLIGHAAVYSLVERVDSFAVALLVAAYVLPILYLVMLFAPGHRTAYDRISRTSVIRNEPRSAGQ